MSRDLALFSVAVLLLGACAGTGTSHPVIHTDGGVGTEHDMAHAGGGDMAKANLGCQNGTTLCNGFCANLQNDVHNCGACNNPCPDGESCQTGACVGGCSGNLTSCNGSCVDVTSDNNNCGNCGVVCSNGQTCNFGGCTGGNNNCNNGQVSCNGSCTDTSSDPSNCGACGNACAQAQTCSGGVCGGNNGNCGNGQVSCLGQCTDVSSDPNNCGACGNACNLNENCQGGVCVGGNNGGLTGCNGFIGCLDACMDQNCANMCYADTTPSGQQLAMDLINCLEAACPSTNGGVCDPNKNTPQKCNTCYSNAQMGNGKCVQQITDCQADMP